MVHKKELRKYWYLFTTYYCVLCGHEDNFKERIYDKPKPDTYEKRHVFHDMACDYHFL